MKRKAIRWTLVGLALLLVAEMIRRAAGPTFQFGPDDRPPRGIRIKVEVLNATTTRGLAGRATDHLRDKGFDVVAIGTSREQSDSVVVLDRSNHPDWAKRVAAALGGARIESRPDSSRYLDITVLIGASWRPPPHPFNP